MKGYNLQKKKQKTNKKKTHGMEIQSDSRP
jgi:hypothetical protein